MSTSPARHCDIAIIGAGPAGSVAAALLANKGYDVVVLERQEFPRFSIGESLLPQCMAVLDEAGMTEAVVEAAFQKKDGAEFDRGEAHAVFDFSDKFTAGCATTFEVQRARFDKILADQAACAGAAIHYRREIVEVDLGDECVILRHVGQDGELADLRAGFCFDASGFGQTLANKLDLVRPSSWPARESIFTHVIDRMDPESFDRNKILITVHPVRHEIWFWLIPFSNGNSSLGVVGPKGAFAHFPGSGHAVLQAVVAETGRLDDLLTGAEYLEPCGQIVGYASDIERLFGERFAILGNASGFLDPVFSSGVTIALKSASLAAGVLHRQLKGQSVCWSRDYREPLNRGVRTFREFVAAWYDGRLQDIIFSDGHNRRIRRMICSILAGYAWDERNPYVVQPERRLTALAEACRQS